MADTPLTPGHSQARIGDRSASRILRSNNIFCTTIEVAATQDGLAVIGKGLTPGERVVVEGQYRLTEGARVTPRQPSAPGSSS